VGNDPTRGELPARDTRAHSARVYRDRFGAGGGDLSVVVMWVDTDGHARARSRVPNPMCGHVCAQWRAATTLPESRATKTRHGRRGDATTT